MHFRNGIIPIVRGNQAVYKKLAPRDSYIHMDSFGTMEEMAQYLDNLAKHSEMLVKYFKWKTTVEFTQLYWYTQLCNVLQGISSDETFTTDNINDQIGKC